MSDTKPPAPEGQAKLDIADFARLDLRVGRIQLAEKIPGSRKLVRLQVDLGSESRQLVAGTAEAYTPEAMVGKAVVVLANLKPAKLMGVESNGMILAADVGGRPVLCTFEETVPPGTKVR